MLEDLAFDGIWVQLDGDSYHSSETGALKMYVMV